MSEYRVTFTRHGRSDSLLLDTLHDAQSFAEWGAGEEGSAFIDPVITSACAHCLRPVTLVDGGWHDDLPNPAYCPKALLLTHNPTARHP